MNLLNEFYDLYDAPGVQAIAEDVSNLYTAIDSHDSTAYEAIEQFLIVLRDSGYALTKEK